jgi:uncharacterized protein YegL
MTNPDKVFIGVLVDRSGSMEACRTDMEGGLNTFIKEQASQPGAAELSLAQFDAEYELLHDFAPIQQVQPFQLVPRGMTALLDAMAYFIVDVGEKLAKLPEDDRPGTVIIYIVTDGCENASREWTDKRRVKELVERQKEKYGWKFIFLGANMDAVAEGAALGVDRDSSLTYTVNNARAVNRMASAYTSGVRSGSVPSWTDQDRKRATSR